MDSPLLQKRALEGKTCEVRKGFSPIKRVGTRTGSRYQVPGTVPASGT